jgi:glycosyltransferase involved in cell wall biosynthesis
LQIVHLQYQTAAFRMAGLLHLYPRLFSNPSGPRFVTTFHDLRFPYLFPKAGDRLRQALVWELGRHSAGVVTTNGADAARLAAALGPAVPLAQIPLGATVRLGPPPDEGALAALRARLGLGAGEFVTGHFGFLNRSKGADILFQAAAQARAAGIPLRLLMLGERLGDSDPTNLAYAEGLDRLAAHLKLDPLWTGPLRDEELGAYFALCDVVALPFLDGASLRRTSLQAALLAGRPVISTWPAAEDLAALPEGEGLFYVGRGELGELAGALGRLYGDEGERSKLGAGARRLAARFDWGEIAGQHLGFYERLK